MQKIWGFSADDDFIVKTISRIASYFSSVVSCMSTTCIIITFTKRLLKERGHSKRSWQKRSVAYSWQFACFSVYFLCIVNHKSTSQFSKFVGTSFSRSKRGHLSIVCNEYFCDFAFTSFTKWMGLETYLGRRWGHYL